MDRDARSAAPPPPDVVPPVRWETARAVGLGGAGAVGLAAALGLVATAVGEGTPALLHTARLLLVFAGVVAAGLAISWRPELWQTWAVGAAAGLLAVGGTPAHWDSFRFLFAVLAVVAAARAGLVVLPRAWRVGVVSVLIPLHFFGIFLATTAPTPSPWLVDQLYRRVYEPYLYFTHLRNAYHFYSPQPGPASLVFALLKTEVGEETTADGRTRKKYETRWVVFPKRPADVRDPLGITYFRRLSLTDNVARAGVGVNLGTAEGRAAQARRLAAAQTGSDPLIPMHPAEADNEECRPPYPTVARFTLPSYARHLILEHAPNDRDAAGTELPTNARNAGRTTVKLYRVEHRTLDVQAFIGLGNPGGRPGDPYHPATYRPYYVGEFGFVPDPADPARPKVELLDPEGPLLYWVLPIVPRVPGAGQPGNPALDYVDYLSVHAGAEFDWSQLR